MDKADRIRGTMRQVSLRIAAVALAAGGLTSSIIAVNAASAASSHKAKSIVISTSKNAKFGTILVSGNTLYTLKAGKTPCGAKCLKVWSEVLLPKGATKALAGNGVNATLLGTVKRSHGALQVTYFGQPLYRFFEDRKPGQARGVATDTWGTWAVVVVSKAAITLPAPAPAVVRPGTTTTLPSRKNAPTATTSPTTTTSPPATTTTTPPTTTTTTPPTTTTTAPSSTTTTTPGGGGGGF
jgi:predicted lipoprotein with Yx(FWY)xxD motif